MEMLFYAELLAVEHGLRLAWNLGYRSLLCVTGCQDALNVLTSTLDVRHYWAFDTIHRIRSLLNWDWHVVFELVHREMNVIVDALATKASRDGSPLCVWSYPPPFVVPLLCRAILA